MKPLNCDFLYFALSSFREQVKVKAFCAEGGYRGNFVEYMQEHWQMPVHISSRIVDGFAVLPKRWIVERTLAWNNGQRRLSKDYEKKTICIVMEWMQPIFLFICKSMNLVTTTAMTMCLTSFFRMVCNSSCKPYA